MSSVPGSPGLPLIGNSLKFVDPARPLALRIYTTQGKDFVRLWVQDNGIGIAREHLEKIFGLFQRLHDTQTYPGTGIGLALVRKGAEGLRDHCRERLSKYKLPAVELLAALPKNAVGKIDKPTLRAGLAVG